MPQINFYGTKAAPPTATLAAAFGVDEEPRPLPGGQMTNYIAGNVVLKPVADSRVSTRLAEIFQSLPESPLVRFALPIKSMHGTWEWEGYVAWSFLQGQHVRGQYDKKLAASIAFHELLRDVPKPDFVDTPGNPWSAADWVAWQMQECDYDPEFMQFYEQIMPFLRPVHLPAQLVHGDLSGNFLFDATLAPAIIDFSPAWAPNSFAEGVMLADAIAWENAGREELGPFKKMPDFAQFAWRGVLRRIAEQAEHIQWLDQR